jgi:hypothetical protein
MKHFFGVIACLLINYNVSNAQSCTPLGDEITYGTNNIWIGYAYDNINLTNYSGFVNEGTVANAAFDQSFGGDNVMYATNGCSVSTSTFSMRYRLTKTFANDTYMFTVGGDDGYRLSIDGGATWLINRWSDQSYTLTTQTVALNGTYNLVLEYYENSGGNRISFNVVPVCVGTGSTSVYGAGNIWNGYVYDGVNFNLYAGMVTEGTAASANFDENFGGDNVSYATSNCPVQTETFSVRYRLSKNYPPGNYVFTVSGDDGYRLSIDGGATWIINRWVDQGYTSTPSSVITLNGTYNLVLEYYENGGANRITFTEQLINLLPVDIEYFTAAPKTNAVQLNWAISAASTPKLFEVERSSNGVQFSVVKTVNPLVSSLRYTITDNNAADGKNYYRLRITDMNGAITYSDIVTVQMSRSNAAHIMYPSVVTDSKFTFIPGVKMQHTVFTVTDISGRIVNRQQAGTVAAGTPIQINVSAAGNKAAPGMYLVHIAADGSEMITEKIIVQQ